MIIFNQFVAEKVHKLDYQMNIPYMENGSLKFIASSSY